MEKRLLKIFVCLLAVLLSCLALTACFGDDGQLDEQTWKKAFDEFEKQRNITIALDGKDYFNDSEYPISYTVKIDGNKSLKLFEGEPAEYNIFENGITTRIRYDSFEDTWQSSEMEEDVIATTLELLPGGFEYIKNNFAKFSYNASKGTYFCADLDIPVEGEDEPLHARFISFQFKNGLLSRFEVSATYPNGSSVYSFAFSDIGTTEVTVPHLIHEWTAWSEAGDVKCNEPSNRTRTCKVCGKEDVDEEPLMHEYGEAGICTACGLSEGLAFELLERPYGNAYTLVGIGTCTDTEIVIPSHYMGLPVISISKNAFADCSHITGIVLPSGIYDITWDMLEDCSALRTLHLSNTARLGNFYYMRALPSLASITVDASNPDYCAIDGHLYTKDGKTLLRYAPAAPATEFTVPDGVEHIATYAFEYCLNLTKLHLGKDTVSFDEDALYTLYEVRELCIGPALKLRTGSFAGHAPALQTITVDEKNKDYTVLDGVLYSADMTTLVLYPAAKTGYSFSIPYGVERIEDNAFDDLFNLAVTLPDTVTYNGGWISTISYASFEIENGVYYHGNWVVETDMSVSGTLTIREGTVGIAPYALSGLYHELHTLILPESLRYLNADFFGSVYGTVTLNSIIFGTKEGWELVLQLPSGEIERQAIDVGNSADVIGWLLTEKPTNVTSISLERPAPKHEWSEWSKSSATKCNEAFYSERSCLTCGEKQVKAVQAVHEYGEAGICTACGLSAGLAFTLNADGQSYTLTGIGSCTDKELVIPAHYMGLPVTAIGYSAFAYKEIVSVKLPSGIVSMGSNVFYFCENLKSVHFSDTVTQMWSSPFVCCEALEEISVDAHNPQYKAVGGHIYTKDGKTLVFYCPASPATEFTVPDGVESIADGAFDSCSNLEILHLGKDTVDLDPWAINSCTVLRELHIGPALERHEDFFLRFCSKLQTVTVDPQNQNYTVVGGVLYSRDMKTLVLFPTALDMTEFTVPSSVTRIEDYAFYNTSKLTVTLHEGITYNGWKYTYGASVENVDGVYYVGKWLVGVSSQYAGETLTVREGTLGISPSAFNNVNSEVVTVILPESLRYINTNPFNYNLDESDPLASVVFGNTTGWTLYESRFGGSVTATEIDVSDPEAMAELFKEKTSNHINFYLVRTEP